MSYCTMKDGKTCLLAASVSDNDWTAELLLLSQEDEDSLTIVGDLAELSRKNSETSENFLSGWARFGYVSPSEEENQFTVTWSETLRAPVLCGQISPMSSQRRVSSFWSRPIRSTGWEWMAS
ncbi:MAG: hypothetical protein V8S22_03115 [Lachnospiraceae bacterium]